MLGENDLPPKDLDKLSNDVLLKCLLRAYAELASGYQKNSYAWSMSIDRFETAVLDRMKR